MRVNVICYPKCTTCQKAVKWLEDKSIEIDYRDIKLLNPNEKELREWIKKSGLPIKRFFNTSGLVYRELELTKKLPMMSEDEQIRLLATDGMLVKRPILISKNKVLVGFKEKDWAEL